MPPINKDNSVEPNKQYILYCNDLKFLDRDGIRSRASLKTADRRPLFLAYSKIVVPVTMKQGPIK